MLKISYKLLANLVTDKRKSLELERLRLYKAALLPMETKAPLLEHLSIPILMLILILRLKQAKAFEPSQRKSMKRF